MSDNYVVIDWPRGTLGKTSLWEFWNGHDNLQASCEATERARVGILTEQARFRLEVGDNLCSLKLERLDL